MKIHDHTISHNFIISDISKKQLVLKISTPGIPAMHFAYIKWVSRHVSSRQLFVVSRPRRGFFIPFNMMGSHAWLLEANANKTDRLLETSPGLFHVLGQTLFRKS